MILFPFFLALILSGCTVAELSTVVFDNASFSVEVADSAYELQRGLMYRESIELGSGMLFVFEQEGTHAFWMKNTLIPLDILFIGKDMTAVDIYRNVSPCIADPCLSYVPHGLAKYALEVNAGEADVIQRGDAVEFR